MTSGSRRTRNYKEKRPMLAFGQIILPIAALIAVGLLFVGIKLFFLTPPDRSGIEVIAQAETIQPAYPETENPEEKSKDMISAAEPVTPPEQKPQPKQKIALAGPVNPAQPTPPVKNSTKTAEPRQPQTVKPAAKPNAQPTAKPAATQTSKQPQTTTAQTTAASKWVVQIGAFSKEEGAKTLSDQAKKEGYPVSVSTTNASSGAKFYRVRVNAGDTREKAEKLAAELEKKGYPVSVFPSQ